MTDMETHAVTHDAESINRDGYDKDAERYVSWRLNRENPHLVYIDRLAEAMAADPTKSRVLELGCGAGLPVTAMLAERFAHVVANDLSKSMLDMAKKNLADTIATKAKASGGRIEFVEGSMLALDYPAGSFDAVVAFFSIIHLSVEQQRTMVHQMHTWLAPSDGKPGHGGMLLCNFGATPNPGMVSHDWLGGMTAFWSGLGADASKSLLEEAGFTILFHRVDHEPDDAPFLWVIARADGPAAK